MTAPVPVREVARRQRNQQGNIRSRGKARGRSRVSKHRHRHRHRHRQRIITGRKKTTHWPEKTITRHEKNPAGDRQNASGMALFFNLILFSGIFRGIFVRELRTDLAIMLQPRPEILSEMFWLLVPRPRALPVFLYTPHLTRPGQWPPYPSLLLILPRD